jgi:FkbM family methyltransferase
MLIPFSQVLHFLKERNIQIRGILHIGAHECEEKTVYEENGFLSEHIDWVEANPNLVSNMLARGIPVHNIAVSDKEEIVPFHITNNGQSSSLLELGTHKDLYSWCVVTHTIHVKTQRIDSFLREKNIPVENRNFWNLDIQGAELKALKGAGDALQYVDAIYTEVNTDEVYKQCALLPELDSYLETYGFKREMISMWGNDGWGDALYVRIKN